MVGKLFEEFVQVRLGFRQALLYQIGIRRFFGRDAQAVAHLQFPNVAHLIGQLLELVELLEVLDGDFAIALFLQPVQKVDVPLVCQGIRSGKRCKGSQQHNGERSDGLHRSALA